jgi:hypothetical protein
MHMVDEVARPWSARTRVSQPEDELPLQTRCRCSGPSYIGQPQVAESASLHQQAGAHGGHRSRLFPTELIRGLKAHGTTQEGAAVANHLNAPKHQAG